MKILIIEDENPAAKRLEQLITLCESSAQILAVQDSIETASQWLEVNPPPDLIFMDIQLADGLSFDIFKQVEVKSPVIFTTAFDQYTLKAFKVNSVDYLLKPIDREELCQAISKYKQIHTHTDLPDKSVFEAILQSMTANQKSYKERFLVKSGNSSIYVKIDEVAYFYSEDNYLQVQTKQGKKYFIDYTLDQLEPLLHPADFFRISRKIILSIDAIQKIHPHFNNRLKLDLSPIFSEDVLVSRERVKDFKQWLDK
jgi:DNA-binding LytR/AlgR family response regulator